MLYLFIAIALITAIYASAAFVRARRYRRVVRRRLDRYC